MSYNIYGKFNSDKIENFTDNNKITVKFTIDTSEFKNFKNFNIAYYSKSVLDDYFKYGYTNLLKNSKDIGLIEFNDNSKIEEVKLNELIIIILFMQRIKMIKLYLKLIIQDVKMVRIL